MSEQVLANIITFVSVIIGMTLAFVGGYILGQLDAKRRQKSIRS